MDNRNKKAEVDESILEETPPNINEPQKSDETPEEPIATEEVIEEVITDEQPDASVDDASDEEGQEEKTPEVPQETDEQRELRFKAQQSEAQIQAAKARAILDKVAEANQVVDPTEAEVRAFVAQDGADWDSLTPFEQATAKRQLKQERKDQILDEVVQSNKKIDEWASKVDTFIDETDGKPEFIKLSGHEADFRKFAMQESHRNTPIDVLLDAFVNRLPATAPKRNKLFETSGGGEKPDKPGKITDADELQRLRVTNPREYKRKIKSGAVDLDI